jgi:hypothetical protein
VLQLQGLQPLHHGVGVVNDLVLGDPHPGALGVWYFDVLCGKVLATRAARTITFSCRRATGNENLRCTNVFAADRCVGRRGRLVTRIFFFFWRKCFCLLDPAPQVRCCGLRVNQALREELNYFFGILLFFNYFYGGSVRIRSSIDTSDKDFLPGPTTTPSRSRTPLEKEKEFVRQQMRRASTQRKKKL